MFTMAMQEVSYYLDDVPTEVTSEPAGFAIHRSLISNILYSVFAVDFYGEILYPICVDVTWDWAVQTKENHDKELQESVEEKTTKYLTTEET